MFANEIPLSERQFLQKGLNDDKISMIQVTHPDGNPFHLHVYSPGHDSYYYQEKFPKERIVLHFSAGFLQGDVPWLTQPNRHISVPFVIGHSGEIFNLYRSAYWSHHLGMDDWRWDKTSIGIELSNIGPLVLENQMLCYEVSRRLSNGQVLKKRVPYCAVSENSYYTRQKYRNYDFFATFTTAQYDALARLLVYLTNRYKIPPIFLPLTTRFEALPQNRTHRGILSHVNYRKSGKWDIGPAFDWVRLEASVRQASIFQP